MIKWQDHKYCWDIFRCSRDRGGQTGGAGGDHRPQAYQRRTCDMSHLVSCGVNDTKIFITSVNLLLLSDNEGSWNVLKKMRKKEEIKKKKNLCQFFNLWSGQTCHTSSTSHSPGLNKLTESRLLWVCTRWYQFQHEFYTEPILVLRPVHLYKLTAALGL